MTPKKRGSKYVPGSPSPFIAARVLATYLIPGCVGRGGRVGSENSSGAWKAGGHFSEKKAPAATYPQVQGFQKSRGHFMKKKSACGNVPRSSGLPKRWGPFFKNILSRSRLNRLLIYPIMVTKKIHLVQKPFRLLFPATISLKSF